AYFYPPLSRTNFWNMTEPGLYLSMATEHSTLVELNRAQTVSEEDTFAIYRYRQFAKHLSERAIDLLDVGCNTGRGGVVLKSQLPSSRLIGLDCVPERVSCVDHNIYDRAICS